MAFGDREVPKISHPVMRKKLDGSRCQVRVPVDDTEGRVTVSRDELGKPVYKWPLVSGKVRW